MKQPQPDDTAPVGISMVSKQYLELLFAQLKTELVSLTSEMRRQGDIVHNLEVNLGKQLTKIESDLDRAFEKIRDLEKEIEQEEALRVQSDISLGTRIANHENAQEVAEKKHAEAHKSELVSQSVENDRNKNTRRILYAIASMVIAQLILFIWTVIINGGIKNIP